MRHVQDLTSSCSDGVPGATGAAAVTSMPVGSSGASSTGRVCASISSRRSTSRYSASDSWPVESARPKCSFGRGENPSV
jgi:hypothetical protein